MRDGITQQIQDLLAAAGITTVILARLDLASGPVGLWTGSDEISITGSGDTSLDGMTFSSMAHGVTVEISDNTFSYSGSDALTMTVAVPASPSAEMAALEAFPSEYQGRDATFWRGLLIKNPLTPLAAPQWVFKRVRSGAMDKIEIRNDGSSHTISLTIESHSASISLATNATYMDQTKFDPNDRSQVFVPGLANGGMAPTNGSATSGYSYTPGSAGLGGVGDYAMSRIINKLGG